MRLLTLLALSLCLAFVTVAFTLPPSPITDTPSSMNFDQTVKISQSTGMTEFISQIRNGKSGQLVGIYAPDIMALPVIQQPAKSPSFVSTAPDTLTQFGMASQYGTIGILAHNNLAGANFYKFAAGDLVALVYGDGVVKFYQIDRIQRFQALSPESPFSNFIELDHPDKQITSTELFNRIYSHGDPLVFQTCLAVRGNLSWGRIFVTAKAFSPRQAAVAGPRVFKVSTPINAFAR
ncbi:MAG TPA: hypothetical protein VMT46_18100 [Anaerolineaceae bacterium]|nr:hypothetical protein [Anaerolineaceae bacterium]